MVPEVARAHRDSLEDWARAYAGDTAPGSSEVAFMLRRAAKQIDVMLGAAPEPERQVTDEPRAG